MLEFLIPLVFIVFFAGFLSLLSGRRIEEVLPVSLFISVLVLYVSAVLGFLKAGAVSLIAFALCFPVFFLIFRRKGKNPECLIFSGGFYAFLIIYSAVFALNLNRGFWFWDEVSHWGPMVKEMLRIGSLYSEPASSLAVHKDYPPAFSLFEYLWCFLCGGYREAFLYRALQTFCLSLALPFAFRQDGKQGRGFVPLFCAAVLLAAASIFSVEFDFFRMAYIDVPVSFLFAYLAASFFFDRDICPWTILKYSAGLSFLLIAKQITVMMWGFFLIYALFAIILRILRLRKNASDSDVRREVLRAGAFLAAVVVIPVMFYLSWGNYVRASGIKGQFDGGRITASRFIDIAKNSDKDSFRHTSLVNYLSAAVSRPLFKARNDLGSNILPAVFLCIFACIMLDLFRDGKKSAAMIFGVFVSSIVLCFLSSFIPFAFLPVCLIALSAFFALSLRTSDDCEKNERLLFSSSFALFSILYFAAMMLSYVFCFEEVEGPRLASFERYMSSWPAAMFYAFFMISAGAGTLIGRGVKYMGMFAALSLFMISFFGTLSFRLPVSYSSITDAYRADADSIMKKTPENSSVFFVAQDGGLSLFSISYLASPRKFNFDIFDIGADDPECAIFNSDISPYDFAKKLRDEHYDFVYVRKADPSFIGRYGMLFDIPPESGSLYRVCGDSGRTELKKN